MRFSIRFLPVRFMFVFVWNNFILIKENSTISIQYRDYLQQINVNSKLTTELSKVIVYNEVITEISFVINKITYCLRKNT